METSDKPTKRIGNFRVDANVRLTDAYAFLKLTPEEGSLADADIRPGQFVQVATPANATYLRRPISVCNVDLEANQLWLLIRRAGAGTKALCDVTEGDTLNLIYPLGNGFTVEAGKQRVLLIGGGVGVAPLLYLGAKLKDQCGIAPEFLLGARSEADLLLVDNFAQIGNVNISTDDGSAGEHGLVTTNSVLNNRFDRIYCCGPMPMMKAVARIARSKAIDCEVSLENVMACGVGACLCCVEKTVKGNLCVCQDGPVFNIDQLLWE